MGYSWLPTSDSNVSLCLKWITALNDNVYCEAFPLLLPVITLVVLAELMSLCRLAILRRSGSVVPIVYSRNSEANKACTETLILRAEQPSSTMVFAG